MKGMKNVAVWVFVLFHLNLFSSSLPHFWKSMAGISSWLVDVCAYFY